MGLFKKIEIKLSDRHEREIRFLGMPICQYGWKIEDGVKEKYFKFLPKSLEKRALDKIIFSLPKDVTYDHVWVVRTVGLGEAQLLNFMMKELARKWKVKNYCFVSHRIIYKEMFEMYSDTQFYPIEFPYNSFAPYLLHRNKKYRGIYFHIHHCTVDESMAWLRRCQQGDTRHAIDAYKAWSGIDSFESVYPIFTRETVESALNKVKRIGLNIDQFIFIAPEAKGTESLPETFWRQLVGKWEKKGMGVFVNTVKGITAYGLSCRLNVAEAVYIASLAKKIIAIRCGFSELLAALKEREGDLYILYPRFRSISPENFLSIYSFGSYPFVNKKIKEIVVNSPDTSELINNL